MHTDYPHRITFKKPGMHRPVAGTRLVLKLVVYIEGKSNVVTVGTVYCYLLKINYSMMNKTDMSVRIYHNLVSFYTKNIVVQPIPYKNSLYENFYLAIKSVFKVNMYMSN